MDQLYLVSFSTDTVVTLLDFPPYSYRSFYLQPKMRVLKNVQMYFLCSSETCNDEHADISARANTHKNTHIDIDGNNYSF